MRIYAYCLFVYVVINSSCVFSEDLPLISNLNLRCMQCICYAGEGDCDRTLGCEKGICGAFRISRLYWMDAGKVTFPLDDPERNNVYQDCSLDYRCSLRIVLSYFQLHGKDCNGDGITDCDDYAMLHFNGKRRCDLHMNRTELARTWWRKYNECDPLDKKSILI